VYTVYIYIYIYIYSISFWVYLKNQFVTLITYIYTLYLDIGIKKTYQNVIKVINYLRPSVTDNLTQSSTARHNMKPENSSYLFLNQCNTQTLEWFWGLFNCRSNLWALSLSGGPISWLQMSPKAGRRRHNRSIKDKKKQIFEHVRNSAATITRD